MEALINDPDLDGSYKIKKGLHMAREVLIEVLRTGLPAGAEFLEPNSPQYIADAVSWGAIGARTTESQVTASSLPECPCPSASKTAPMATCR